MSTLLADVRFALRTMLKNRGFAAVALLTIALGVGANTAVFSVVNATLIQPLPFKDPERLVAVYETAMRAEVERRAVSYPNFVDWRRGTRSFEGMSTVLGARFTLSVGDMPERVVGELVSASHFDVLGIQPARGRGFSPRDDAQGAAPVVVLSDALWERAFARDPAVVGRGVRVDGELCTVVGVMPPRFGSVIDRTQLWAPIERFAGADLVKDRRQRSIDVVVARLKPHVTVPQASAEMDALAAQLDQQHPSEAGARGAAVQPLRTEFFGDMRPMLFVLLGAVGFVLLIACVNVANLLLARGNARQRELAVRCALGARRGRIVRQLLTESVTLSVAGGAAGLLAAFWSIDLIVALSPIPFPEFVRIAMNLRVLAFTLAVCVASGILFGVAPALAASRTDIVGTLRTGGRESDGGGSPLLRRGLVVAEIALALVLLVGAGLMLRTMERLRRVDPGFQPDGLVTLRLTVPQDGAASDEAANRLAGFARTLLEKVRALPTVTAASLSSDVPLGSSSSATIARAEGREDASIRIYRHAVSPGHFRTIGAPLLEGRDFTEHDARAAEQRVVIVSRSMADRHWPAGDALHKRLRIGDRMYEIVGIIGDIRHRTLLEAETADPDVFFPLFQLPARAFAVLARSSGDPRPLVPAIRRTLQALNPGVPVFEAALGRELVARQTSRARFSSVLLGAFALVALALTMVGIYGVTAYTVSRQTRQVGIRMALGATRADVLRLILTGGATFIGAGLAVGTLAALGLTRLLSSLIYGVSATDPVTFAAVISLLAFVAIAACLMPAAKAMRIDPVVALRSE